MEKFGIFTLLDALSALSDVQNEGGSFPSAQRTDETPAPTPPLPPQQNETPVQEFLPKKPTTDAFSSLIARQEAISKRIDAKK